MKLTNREPTPEMVDRGQDVLTQDWISYELLPAVAVWQAMHDAALSGDSQSEIDRLRAELAAEREKVERLHGLIRGWADELKWADGLCTTIERMRLESTNDN